jgi:hypothetical protein
VLAAVLKDQYGVLAELDNGSRPACSACRRTNMVLHLTKTIG